ncbi:MAG: D-alanine--D-alanine ligase [Bdellovibrionales bacterium]|nr:D-alanine--D-alanine ligase [Bdellovibrionales bacterium]
MKKKVALIMGGLSAERDVSLVTGAAFEKALKELNYEFQVIDAKEDLPKILAEKKSQIDVALLALHGKLAEDGVVQGICEYLKIPYSGSGVLGSSLGFDKYFTKQILSFNKIPNARFELVHKKSVDWNQVTPPFDFPLVVKPSREGSSVGVSICKNTDEFVEGLKLAAQYDSEILVEEYLEGPELTVPILVDRALTPIEIRPKKGYYDYANKYTSGNTEYIIPPELSAGQIAKLKDIALKAHRACRARVYSRIDFRMHKGEPYVMEINTLPGCTPTSLVPKAAAYEGISFTDFIQTLINHAGLDYEGVR